MKSVLLSLQTTLVVRGANTCDHAVFTSHSILVVFVLNLGKPNCCFSCVELLQISWFGYFIRKPSKVCEFCSKTNDHPEGCQDLHWFYYSNCKCLIPPSSYCLAFHSLHLFHLKNVTWFKGSLFTLRSSQNVPTSPSHVPCRYKMFIPG